MEHGSTSRIRKNKQGKHGIKQSSSSMQFQHISLIYIYIYQSYSLYPDIKFIYYHMFINIVHPDICIFLSIYVYMSWLSLLSWYIYIYHYSYIISTIMYIYMYTIHDIMYNTRYPFFRNHCDFCAPRGPTETSLGRGPNSLGKSTASAHLYADRQPMLIIY